MKAKFDSLTGQNDPDGRRGKAEAELRNLVREIYPFREDPEYRWNRIIYTAAREVCRKNFNNCDAADIERIIAEIKSSS